VKLAHLDRRATGYDGMIPKLRVDPGETAEVHPVRREMIR
jgi:hypothetical protein